MVKKIKDRYARAGGSKENDESSLIFQEVKRALEIFGDRWSVLILMTLLASSGEPLRFGDMQSRVDGINPRTLTKRLKMLEGFGLISKKEFDEFPPRTEYEVTEKTLALKKVIEELKKWAKKNCED